jgi:hypothetical protein
MKKTLAIAQIVFLLQIMTVNAETHIGFDTDRVGKNLVVSQIYEASMASASGIKEGDIVVGIGAASVRTPKDVVRLTSTRKPIDVVKVKIKRSGETYEIKVPLVDGDGMRAKSLEARRQRKDVSEKMFFDQRKEQEVAEASAVAADPELPSRLEQLLGEYELVSQSNATWLQKAIHCDRIADCYLKLRNKDAYKHWKTQAAIHRQPPMTTGRTSWP